MEAGIENRESKEHGLREEIISMKDIINGKDKAI